MSSSIAPEAVNVGDYVKFTVYDDASITYSGKVIGIATYPVAKSMGSDIAARHEQVKAKIVATDVNGTSIADVVDQTFLVLDSGNIMPTVIAFEWIVGRSVELIELGSTYMIKLLNCSKEKANEAVSILRANGISCKLNIIY